MFHCFSLTGAPIVGALFSHGLLSEKWLDMCLRLRCCNVSAWEWTKYRLLTTGSTLFYLMLIHSTLHSSIFQQKAYHKPSEYNRRLKKTRTAERIVLFLNLRTLLIKITKGFALTAFGDLYTRIFATAAGSRWTRFGVRVPRTLDYPTTNLSLW